MFHLQHLFSTVWKLTTWGFNWQIVTAPLTENETRDFLAELMKYNFGNSLSVVLSRPVSPPYFKCITFFS